MLNQQLFPPIVLATVVSVIAFALLWRAGKASDRAGTPTWTYLGITAAYVGPVLAFVYFSGRKAAASGFDVFMVALAANGFAVVVVYGLMAAFVHTRGQPLLDRIPTMLGVLFLVGVIVVATVQLGHG